MGEPVTGDRALKRLDPRSGLRKDSLCCQKTQI